MLWCGNTFSVEDGEADFAYTDSACPKALTSTPRREKKEKGRTYYK